MVPRNARSRDRDSLSRVRRSRPGNEGRVELDDLERNGISGCLLDREKQEFFAIRSSKLIFDRILIKSIENDIGRIDRNGEMKRMEDFASILRFTNVRFIESIIIIIIIIRSSSKVKKCER